MTPPALYPTLSMLAILTVSSMAVMGVAVLAPAAAPEIGVDPTRVGDYTALVYFFAMGSGAVTGDLVGRHGAIRVCQATMMLVAAGMVLFAVAKLPAVLASAVALGCAYGPFNPASAHVLLQLSSPRWRPFIFSVKQTGVPLGGALAGAILPVLVLGFGWKSGAVGIAVLAFVMAVMLERLRPRFDADHGHRGAWRPRALLAPLALALGDRTLRRYTIVAFTFAGCQLSVAAFMVVYLTDALSMSLVQAGSVFAALQIGAVTGRLAWGMLAARMLRPRSVLVGLGVSISTCLVATALMTPAWPLGVVFVLAVVLGASSFGWNGVMLSEVATNAPAGRAAEATAGMQVVMFGGIAVFPPIFGAVVGTTHRYDWTFVGLAMLALAGSALALTIGRVRLRPT